MLQQRLLGAQLRVTRQHFAAALQSVVPCSLRAVALPEVCVTSYPFHHVGICCIVLSPD